MAKLSAFADEVTDDFLEQVKYLASENVDYIEPRFIDKKNIMDLTQNELNEVKKKIQDHGLKVSAIGSPIGKVKLDEPFEPHLDKFKHAVDLAMFLETPFIRMFSYYAPKDLYCGKHQSSIMENMKEHYNIFWKYTDRDLNLGTLPHAAERQNSSKFWYNSLRDTYLTFDCAKQKVQGKGGNISIERKKPSANNRRDLRSTRTQHKPARRNYPGKNRRKYVFEIGHDELHIRELHTTLTDNFNVIPIILEDQPDLGAKTIIEKFETYARKCYYAIAVLTPDDIVQGDGAVKLRPRPNIHFELGWFCRHLGRRRILILVREGTDLTAFSDFQGVLYKTFKLHINEISEDIKRELTTVGFCRLTSRHGNI